MAVRALLETILAAALALVLCIAAIAVWSLVDGSTLAESIESGLSTAPLVGYPLAAVALGWLIVNLASKRSSSAARFWFNLLILFLVALFTVAFWFIVFVLIVGGFGALVAAVGIAATAGFFVAGALSLVLVHFVFFRRPNVDRPVEVVALVE
ncbi:MAG TPA: hypothetical protein VKZ73_06925 [Microbacterium sp.]|nr:hypothetical protein [Microbacterium sp.]